MFTKKLKQASHKLEKSEVFDLYRRVEEEGLLGLSPCATQMQCAVFLFNLYEMEISFCIAGITASIPKKKWDNPINKAVPAYKYQSFYQDISDEEKENQKFIHGSGGQSFRKAVFYAVLNARIAGVI